MKIYTRFSCVKFVIVLVGVFVTTGGAFAAQKYLINSIKQINPKVVAQLKGKNGTNGKDGAPGPAGQQGVQGERGAQGDRGPQGPEGGLGPAGPTGAAGVMGATGPTGPKGTSGTTGPQGVTGPEGVCSTSSCHLPVNVSEKGEWNATGTGEVVGTAISFTVPLEASLEKSHVHFIGELEGEGEAKEATAITKHECEGTYKAPKAASKQLCVFTKEASKFETLFFPIASVAGGSVGADTTGAQIVFFPEKPTELFLASGSWAVTG